MTGLSMNPDYSVAEKREIIEWYKDYFSQFTPTELQTLSTESLPPVDAAMEGLSTESLPPVDAAIEGRSLVE